MRKTSLPSAIVGLAVTLHSGWLGPHNEKGLQRDHSSHACSSLLLRRQEVRSVVGCANRSLRYRPRPCGGHLGLSAGRADERGSAQGGHRYLANAIYPYGRAGTRYGQRPEDRWCGGHAVRLSVFGHGPIDCGAISFGAMGELRHQRRQPCEGGAERAVGHELLPPAGHLQAGRKFVERDHWSERSRHQWTETREYNSRLQPCKMQVQNSAQTPLLALQWKHSLSDPDGACEGTGTDNNGNVLFERLQYPSGGSRADGAAHIRIRWGQSSEQLQ